MSKPSAATAPKNPTPLSGKSAWAKGPPQRAPAPITRSYSPTPSPPVHATLGQGVPIKDGVSIPRGNVGAAAVKQGSAVTTASMPSNRLNINSNAFVPTGRAKITLKSADGQEVKLENLTKLNTAPSSGTSALPPRGSAYREGSPRTPTRRPASIRMETEDQRKKRLADEEEKEWEKTRAKVEAEEKARIEREEAERRVKEEEERKRKEEAEKERARKEEEEKERLRKAEKKRIRLEQERLAAEERRKQDGAEKEQHKQDGTEERRQQDGAEKDRRQQDGAEKERRKQDGAGKEQEGPEDGEHAQEGPIHVPTTRDEIKEKDKELGLSDTNNKNVAEAPLSAFVTARYIDDIGTVQYPEGISSPKPELNANAKDGKFRYDREFLLQFMSICNLKPDMLTPLEPLGLEPWDQASPRLTRGGKGRHRQGSGADAPSPQASVGLSFGPSSGFGKPSATNPFSMGNFTTSGSKLSGDERSANSTSRSAPVNKGPSRQTPVVRFGPSSGFGKPSSANPFSMGNFTTSGSNLSSNERSANSTSRLAPVNAVTGLPFNQPIPTQQTTSQGGTVAPRRDRTRSKRGLRGASHISQGLNL